MIMTTTAPGVHYKSIEIFAGQGFSLVTQVSSTNKTDSHDITEILLEVALNTLTLILILQRDVTLKLLRITQPNPNKCYIYSIYTK
jgi:hypothetical protein